MKCRSPLLLLLLAALLLLATMAPSARAETDRAESEFEAEAEAEAETEAEADAEMHADAAADAETLPISSMMAMTGPLADEPGIAKAEIDRMGDVGILIASPSVQSHLPNGRSAAAISAWAEREWASVKTQAAQLGVFGTNCIAGPGLEFTRLGISFNARLADAPFYYGIQDRVAREQPIESCRPVFNVVFCSDACTGYERSPVGLCGQAPAHVMGVIGGMGPLSDAGMSMGVNDMAAKFAGKCAALHVYSSSMGRSAKEFLHMQHSNGAGCWLAGGDSCRAIDSTRIPSFFAFLLRLVLSLKHSLPRVHSITRSLF
jgi:hypothetical protein